MNRRPILALAVLATLAFVPHSARGAGIWEPAPGETWQVQFSGQIDTTVEADVFDLDAFETIHALVDELHQRGRRVVCYINAGAWENWRPDAAQFPHSTKGKKLDGWPGERWLDIRRLDVLKPIMRERIAVCRQKGFDGVEFDNVNGYSNNTGFALTRADQLRYNRWLAKAAHNQSLAAGLKNTLELAEELEPSFDFALLEQCFQYRECDLAEPFIVANKPVVDIEYALSRNQFCAAAADLGIVAVRKRLALDAWRRPCF
jgi:hypothetical protein